MFASALKVLGSASVIALSSQPVLAQPVDSSPAAGGAASESPIDEIVVTAQRRQQALSDVGMSIAAVGGEALATRNVTTVDELSKLVPGLTESESGFATPIYTLRGVGINEPSVGSSSSIAVYIDEVPLAFPVITQGATLDLQRVEVLKGPQGTLYGQNSTGGAINYIANKPTDEFQAGVTGTFGRFGRGSLEGFVSGPVSSTLKARVAARIERGGAWQKSITRDDEQGDIRNLTGRLIVDWAPTDTFRVEFNANGWTDQSDTIAPQLVQPFPAFPALAKPNVVNAPIPPNKARAADWDPGQDFSRDDKFWQTSARAELDISDEVTLTSITAYAHLDREQNSENDGIANAVALRTFQTGKIKSFSQELRIAADFHGVNWVAGLNYSDSKTDEVLLQNLSDSSQLQNVLGRRANGGRVLSNQHIKNYAVFTNLEVPLLSTVTLSGGIRLSNEKRRFRGCGAVFDEFSSDAFTNVANVFRSGAGLVPIAPLAVGQCFSFYTTSAALAQDKGGAQLFTPGFATRVLRENNVPWNVNLNWKPTDRSLVYGRISRGYKSGNFATINTTDNIAYNPITQESLLAYEVGGRISFGRALRLEGALFQYDYTNKQLRARINVGPPFGNINSQDNIPESRLKGAELSITSMPVQNLAITLSGVYVDSELRRYTGFSVNGVRLDFAGSRFNFTPKYSLNADISYNHPLTNELDGFAGVNVAYRSKTSGVFAPRDISLDPSLALFDIDAYTTVDAQLGIEANDEKWRVFLWGKNILNEYYWTNVLRGSDIVYRYAGMPASYGVTASFKY